MPLPCSGGALQGLKHAVPKNILTMMNVEGMSRENVASHLQVGLGGGRGEARARLLLLQQ